MMAALLHGEHFDKAALPSSIEYFAGIGNPLHGRGAWRDAMCPFHGDTRPSLRVKVETGSWRCMACGAHGGDVLAFEMQRTGRGFRDAAQALGAWR